MKIECWALIVSVCSMAVGVVASILSIHFFRKNRQTEFFNKVYESTKPIFDLVTDALLVCDLEEFGEVKTINESEQKLISNFEALYAYANSNKLYYLKQFSTMQIDDKTYPNLSNSLSFCHVFFQYENDFITLRRQKVGQKLSQNDKKTMSFYIGKFRYLLELSSKYCLSLLCKRNPSKITLKKYYSELMNLSKTKDKSLAEAENFKKSTRLHYLNYYRKVMK